MPRSSRMRLFPLMVMVLATLPFLASAQEEGDLAAPPPNTQAPQAAAPALTNLQMRMNDLETQLRNVTGQLEREQFQNSQLQQTLQRMNTDNDARFQMLEKRLNVQETRSIAPPPPPPTAAAPTPTPETPPQAATPAGTQGSIDEPQHVLGTLSSQAPKGGDPQAMYDAAFQSLRQAKYDEAEARFRDFLKANPKNRLAENAKYWLGESYYVRGKFQDAAVTFAEGFQQFPNGSKAPDNLLKLAMSLGSLKKNPDACTTLAELKKRFPNASAVIRNRAEQEKKTLACT